MADIKITCVSFNLGEYPAKYLNNCQNASPEMESLADKIRSQSSDIIVLCTQEDFNTSRHPWRFNDYITCLLHAQDYEVVSASSDAIFNRKFVINVHVLFKKKSGLFPQLPSRSIKTHVRFFNRIRTKAAVFVEIPNVAGMFKLVVAGCHLPFNKKNPDANIEGESAFYATMNELQRCMTSDNNGSSLGIVLGDLNFRVKDKEDMLTPLLVKYNGLNDNYRGVTQVLEANQKLPFTCPVHYKDGQFQVRDSTGKARLPGVCDRILALPAGSTRIKRSSHEPFLDARLTNPKASDHLPVISNYVIDLTGTNNNKQYFNEEYDNYSYDDDDDDYDDIVQRIKSDQNAKLLTQEQERDFLRTLAMRIDSSQEFDIGPVIHRSHAIRRRQSSNRQSSSRQSSSRQSSSRQSLSRQSSISGYGGASIRLQRKKRTTQRKKKTTQKKKKTTQKKKKTTQRRRR